MEGLKELQETLNQRLETAISAYDHPQALLTTGEEITEPVNNDEPIITPPTTDETVIEPEIETTTVDEFVEDINEQRSALIDAIQGVSNKQTKKIRSLAEYLEIDTTGINNRNLKALIVDKVDEFQFPDISQLSAWLANNW